MSYPAAIRPARLLGALLLSTLVLAGGTIAASRPAAAQESVQGVAFSIPAGPLGQALLVWGRQAGVQISYLDAVTSGKTTTGLSGNLRPEQALARLLSGSGLRYSFSDPRSVVISGRSTAGATAPDGSVVLDAITLNASGATTEGSGSYTTGEAGIARGADSLKEVPQSVTVVTRQALDDQNLTTIEQAMAKTPGIVANREATSAPNFYARGFKINNYQIDGMGTAYESSFRPDFDLAIYDRIEVLRGAEGLFSGAGEPGGSVNLARKRPTERFQSSLALSYGSWNNRRIETDISGPLTRDGSLRGRVVGAWQDRDFFYAPADQKKRVLYGVLEYDLTPDTTISAGISQQRQKGNTWFLGLPTWSDFQLLDIDRGRALNTDWSYADRKITDVFAGVEHRFGADWVLKFSAMRQKFDSDTLRINPTGPIDRETGTFADVFSRYEETGNHSKAADLNLQGRFRAWGREHRLLVGADWRDSDAHQNMYSLSEVFAPGTIGLDNFDQLNGVRPEVLYPWFTFPAYGATQKGLYGRLQLEATDRLHIIVGGRYGNYEYSSLNDYYDSETGALLSSTKTGFKDTGIFTPYAAAIYDVTPDWSVYASLTEIYKPQANYLSGPPDRARPLDPITGRNYELGAKGSLMGGALNASAALYRIERKGEAALDPAYPESSDGTGLSCCYVAQGRIVSEGLDLELSGEIAPDWQLFAGYTWNHNKNTRDDMVFSALTLRHMLKLWTDYTLPGDWSKWTLGGGVTVKSAQATAGTARIAGVTQAYRIEQGGYAVWDAHVGYRIDDRWQMALNVNNIFDKRYYSALGTPTGGNWYGEPRSATLTLRGRF
ncbi:TonB-dependent siderophore receptor [Paracoccus aminovorans]|nr:TonB-dependent receptor [Paracoccus aminovorans]